MFRKLTKAVIIATIMNDDAVTAPEREKILMVLNGTFPEPEPAKQKRVDLITPEKASEILGVTKTTVWSYARNGRLHPIRQSTRKVRYDRAEVEALADRGMNATEGQDD